MIQAANARALSAGTTTDKIFEMVRHLRQDLTTPLVFMTYANVVFSYGDRPVLCCRAEVGVDGLILQMCLMRKRMSSSWSAAGTDWTSSPW